MRRDRCTGIAFPRSPGTLHRRMGKKSAIEEAFSRAIGKKVFFILLLAMIIILSTGVIITFGPLPITVPEVYQTLVNKFIPGVFPENGTFQHVVWKIRLPRIIGGVLAGFGLGICGCVMQAVLKNPLASPFTLGISSGAHFGISLAAVFGITILGGPYLLIGNAFLFALICSGFIIMLSALRGATSETLILAGIAVNYFFGSMNQLFSFIADDDQLRLMSTWGMGSLSDLTWNGVLFMGVVAAICLPLLFSKVWDLNLMTVGDDNAKSMGVDANQTRIFIMVVSSLFVASIVAFIGTIGFIGLVAPHIGRMILGGDHRFLVPAAGGVGAVILMLADALSVNLLGSIVIPTGIMTSAIGVPFFLYLILKGRRKEFWS